MSGDLFLILRDDETRTLPFSTEERITDRLPPCDRGIPHSITAPDKGRSINVAGRASHPVDRRGELCSALQGRG